MIYAGSWAAYEESGIAAKRKRHQRRNHAVVPRTLRHRILSSPFGGRREGRATRRGGIEAVAGACSQDFDPGPVFTPHRSRSWRMGFRVDKPEAVWPRPGAPQPAAEKKRTEITRVPQTGHGATQSNKNLCLHGFICRGPARKYIIRRKVEWREMAIRIAHVHFLGPCMK